MTNVSTAKVITRLAGHASEEEFLRELEVSREYSRSAYAAHPAAWAQVLAALSLAAAQRATAIATTWETTVLQI